MGKKKSKLFSLKEWLTLADTARHLSIVFGEEVSEPDVLRLALDGKLRLSAWFVNHARAKKGRLVPISECPVKVTRCRTEKGLPHTVAEVATQEGVKDLPVEVLEGIRNGDFVLGLSGIHYQDDKFLLLEEDIVSIEGIWDLPLLGNEKLDVEHLFQAMTGGPAVTLINIEGTVVERDGVVCQIQKDFESNEHAPGSKASLEALEERMEVDRLGTKARTELLSKHRENRKRFLERRRNAPRQYSYYPAASLPEDTVYVVRTAALREFEAEIGVADSRLMTRREETTYLNIVGAMLDLLLGKTPAGKAQSVFTSQATVIEGLLARFQDKPGISKRTLEDKLAQAKRNLTSS